MKTRTIITVLITLFALTTSAQDSYIKNRWNFKAAYQINSSNNTTWAKSPIYHIGANYGISKHFECGLNFAYPGGDIPHPQKTYFANCNFHILPFFTDAEDFRIDLYLTAKSGLVSYFYDEYPTIDASGHLVLMTDYKLRKFYYGAGLGLGFYPFKHLGLYAEYTYEDYFNTKAFSLKYGLSVKF